MKHLILMMFLPAMLMAQEHRNPMPAKTGNEAQDDKAKTEWIRQNPEAYRAMGGRPEEVINQNASPAEVPLPQLPAFVAQKRYILVEARAVAAADWQVSEEELRKETEMLRDKIEAGKARLELGANNALRWYINERVDFRGTELRKADGKIEWLFPSERCETCGKTMHLQAQNAPAGVLVYVMKDEDQASKFAFQFTFQLIQ